MICGRRRDEKSWAWNLVWSLPRYLLCVGQEFARPPKPLQPISERLSQWSSDLQTESESAAQRARTRRRFPLYVAHLSYLGAVLHSSVIAAAARLRHRISGKEPAQNLIKRETIDFRFLSPAARNSL
jgi:hypothetical protein